MISRRVRRLLIALPVVIMTTAPAPARSADTSQTGSAYHGPKVYQDGLGDLTGQWMIAQAVYWRRVQYADIAHLAGSKQWHRESHLIDAQLYVQDAKVELVVDRNSKQARDALHRALALVKQGSQGAGKSGAQKIKGIAGNISDIAGSLPQLPAKASAQVQKNADALTEVFAELRDVVEKG